MALDRNTFYNDIKFAINDLPETITYNSSSIQVSKTDIQNTDEAMMYGTDEAIDFSFVVMREDMPSPSVGEKITYDSTLYRIIKINDDADLQSWTINCTDLTK